MAYITLSRQRKKLQKQEQRQQQQHTETDTESQSESEIQDEILEDGNDKDYVRINRELVITIAVAVKKLPVSQK